MPDDPVNPKAAQWIGSLVIKWGLPLLLPLLGAAFTFGGGAVKAIYDRMNDRITTSELAAEAAKNAVELNHQIEAIQAQNLADRMNRVENRLDNLAP